MQSFVRSLLMVIGVFTRGGFGDDDMDEEEHDDFDDDEAPAEDEDEAALDRAWNDARVVRDVTTRIGKVTRASISTGQGRPFIVSTTLQAVDVVQSEMGSQAAMAIAWVPIRHRGAAIARPLRLSQQ